jgi:HSP90 family molecular chaperone
LDSISKLGDLKVTVSLDEEAKTITVSDNGIGVTATKSIINQIAFSGASDFLENIKDKTDDKGQIIGHFGLGFRPLWLRESKNRNEVVSRQCCRSSPLDLRWFNGI